MKSLWIAMLVATSAMVSMAEETTVAPGLLTMWNSDSQARLFIAHQVTPGETVWAQWPDEQGNATCCKRFASGDLHEAQPAGESIAIASGSDPVRTYTAVSEQVNPSRSIFVGIAVVADGAGTDRAGRLLATRGGETSQVWLCWGTEGANVLSDGPGGASALYVGLGETFDEPLPQPQCTDDDRKVMNRAR